MSFECDYFIDKGLEFIYPQRKKEWISYVRAACSQDKNFLKDFYFSINLIENLEKGAEVDDMVEVLKNEEQIDLAVVLKTVLLFSKKGPEFYRRAKKSLLNTAEKYVKVIEAQNAAFQREIELQTSAER